MDKDQYDRPEDENSLVGRALSLLVCALVIVAIFYVIFNTNVFR